MDKALHNILIFMIRIQLRFVNTERQ